MSQIVLTFEELKELLNSETSIMTLLKNKVDMSIISEIIESKAFLHLHGTNITFEEFYKKIFGEEYLYQYSTDDIASFYWGLYSLYDNYYYDVWCEDDFADIIFTKDVYLFLKKYHNSGEMIEIYKKLNNVFYGDYYINDLIRLTNDQSLRLLLKK